MARRVVTGAGSVPTLSPLAAEKRPDLGKFGTASFVTPQRVEWITAALEAGDPVVTEAWAELLAEYPLTRTPTGPPTDPYTVPSTYLDPTGSRAAVEPFRFGGVAAYNFALRYAVTGDQAAATAAVAQMDPWANLGGWNQSGGNNTLLTWVVHWPMYLAACSMLEGATAYTTTFRDKMVDVTSRSVTTLGLTATDPSNNQGDWRNLMFMASGAFTGTRATFDLGVQRWKSAMDRGVEPGGHLWQELLRQGGEQGNGEDGLDYCLHALRAKVYAAEVARVNGVWLYDYKTPSGHGLRDLYEQIAPWAANPASYPFNTSGILHPMESMGHFEVLNTLWPNVSGQAVLDEFRPCYDMRGAPHMTVTHAGFPLRA